MFSVGRVKKFKKSDARLGCLLSQYQQLFVCMVSICPFLINFCIKRKKKAIKYRVSMCILRELCALLCPLFLLWGKYYVQLTNCCEIEA